MLDTKQYRNQLKFKAGPSFEASNWYATATPTGIIYAVDKDGALWMIEGATMRPVTVVKPLPAPPETEWEQTVKANLARSAAEDTAGIHDVSSGRRDTVDHAAFARVQALAGAKPRDAEAQADMEANKGELPPGHRTDVAIIEDTYGR